MSAEPIGVGIIGASPRRSWAAQAHVPALHASADFELRAVSTTRPESAQEAATQFGARSAFDNHAELIAQPDVDLVVVAVKVPHHRELVTAALDAGKAVFCEWPLGRTLDETVQLAARARRQGVATAVGLQTRGAPIVVRVRKLVRDGYLGRVLSTTMVGTTGLRAVTDQALAYMADDENGAGLITIGAGHALDALAYALGEWATHSAVVRNQRPMLTVRQTGQPLAKTAADQLAVIGQLDSGAVAVAHFRDTLDLDGELYWEINGTEGNLWVTAPSSHPGMSALTLRGESSRGDLPATSAGSAVDNVGWIYARLADDIRDRTATAPTFDDAVARHSMLASLTSY